MKQKILAGTIALLLVTVMIMPVFGEDDPSADVPTSATIDGNIPPEVRYSWELPDDDPDTEGTQVNPVPGGTTDVDKYIVVYHGIHSDNIASVREVTYYPTPGYPDPAAVEHSRSDAVLMTDSDEIEAAKVAAVAAGLITQVEADQIDFDIDCNRAAMYHAINVMDTCDEPGWYIVAITACSDTGAASEEHLQYFEYISGIGFELDFGSVDYGLISPAAYKEICGDDDMTTLDKPTIENICNDPIELCVKGTDMLKVGDPSSIIPVGSLDVKLDGETIDPLTTSLQCFPTDIDPCSTKCMGFSITAPYGTCEGTYEGTITLEIHHG